MNYTLEHVMMNLPSRVSDWITKLAKEKMRAEANMPLSNMMDDIVDQPYEKSRVISLGDFLTCSPELFEQMGLTAHKTIDSDEEPAIIGCFEQPGPLKRLDDAKLVPHQWPVDMSQFLLMEQLTSNEPGLGDEIVD